MGSIGASSRLADLPVTVIDLSQIQDGKDYLQHSTAATSSTMIALVDGMGTLGLEIFRGDEHATTLLESGILAIQGITSPGTGGTLR